MWRFRGRLGEGILQDIKYRYAGSILGLAWSVLFPLIQLSIYATVYVFIFKVRPNGMKDYEYVVMVFAGLLPLLGFNEGVSAGASALVANKSLLLSTVFPAELIPVRALIASQIPSLIGFVIVLLAGIALGTATGWALVLAPVIWGLMLLFAGGIAWILSLLSLVMRDIQQVLPLLLMTLTILSPFAYTPTMVPASLKVFLYLNPLSYFVLSFQNLICFNSFPSWPILVAVVVVSLSVAAAGFSIFNRAKFVFFDYA